MNDLSSTTVIVTGGSRGFGLGIAEAFVKAGARVWITGRNEARLRETASRIGAHPFVADIADGASWDRLFETVLAATGRIDVLVPSNEAALLFPVGQIQLLVQINRMLRFFRHWPKVSKTFVFVPSILE